MKIAGSPNNMIGPGNTISGNGVDGVRIDAAAATGNVVQGNRIGTNPGGDAAIANGFNGVVITAANSNRIGGTTGTELNVISGNSKNGIGIGGGASSNVIERNYIGLAADGASALGNGEDGVLVSDSPSNKIGGDVAGTYNIISANGWHGVELRGDGAGANVVQRSILGSDLFGTLDRGNGRAGVYLTSTIGGGGANGNSIGGGAWGAGGNLISGNGGCNDFFATIEATDGAIAIGGIGATRRTCAEPVGVMEQETEFFAALESAATFTVEGDFIELRNADDAIAVHMVRELEIDFPEPGPAAPTGRVTAPQGVNVRTGPGTNFPVIGVAPFGREGEIIGRSADGAWWVVAVPTAPGGMGSVSYTHLTLPTSDLV